MRPYQAITGVAQLSEAHLRRIADGEAPGNLLEGIYLDLPFPAPILTGSQLTHIADGHELVKTSREFSNCLAGYVTEALNNERQFYIWHQPETPKVVFAIDSEVPFGWYLSETRLAENERVPRRLRDELKLLLKAEGVRTEGSVDKLIGPYRSDHNPFMMEDFLELDEAA